MEYCEGNTGRVFLVRFDHGEDFVESIQIFVKAKQIRVGHIHIIGAFLSSEIVTGPQKPEFPPVPNWTAFSDAWEVLGFGTILWEDDIPKIHLHTALGKGKDTLLGCMRKKSEVFLVIEAVITELVNMQVVKKWNERLGISLADFI